MKLKKFNAGVAVAVVVGAAAIYSLLGYAIAKGNSLLSTPVGNAVATVAQSDVLAGSLKYSSVGKQIKEVPWRSFKGKIPGKLKLVKWDDGDKTFYQMSGPVNKGSIKSTDYFDGSSRWGDTTEMEIFFDRGDGNYDQWLINPDNAQILHFNGKNKFRGSSDLPESRYTCEIKGDQLVTTFWCHSSDTPGNLVFNYRYDKATNPEGHINSKFLGWATTGIKGANWDHHDMKRWANP